MAKCKNYYTSEKNKDNFTIIIQFVILGYISCNNIRFGKHYRYFRILSRAIQLWRAPEIMNAIAITQKLHFQLYHMKITWTCIGLQI